MSWIQKLCNTYDYAVTTKAVSDPKNPLPEMGFINKKVELEVTLSADGNFLDADSVPEDQQETLIPCTLESGMARQHPVSPHPLCDMAKYLATPKQLEILKAWCERPGTPQSVKAVYSYLEKRTLLDDLDKRLTEKKCSSWDSNCYVRFCVNDGALDKSGIWMRNDVKDSWKKCFAEDWLAEKPNQLCYVTGEILPAASKHPNISGNTLLISLIGDNCIGHFGGEPQEAVSVSCEATIKAHNAWKWLAARQGTYLFGMTFTAWDTRGFALPDPMKSDPDEDNEDDQVGPKSADTGDKFGKNVANAAHGYWNRMLAQYDSMPSKRLSSVVMMAVDSATGKGRASIVYYQELSGNVYLNNLKNWYQACKWMIGREEEDGKYSYKLRTPLPREICDLIHGEKDNKGQEKLKKQLIKQLLPCITLRRPIPRAIVAAAFHKAANPLSFQDRNNRWDERAWHKAVGITCALSRKLKDKKEEVGDENPMALDENDRDRNYLYGRLLAYADIIENEEQKQRKSSRTTNAMRYMQRFQQRPGDTWITLRIKLEPYLHRLPSDQQSWYRRELSKIEARFLPSEMPLTQPLNVRFLEGYSCQITDHYTSKNENAGEANKED